MFCPRCIITLFVLPIVLIAGNDNGKNILNPVISDLPSKEDLNAYLMAIDRVINFCYGNKNYIDLNFNFGLFLVSVNFKNVLNLKNPQIPRKLSKRINLLLRNNNQLIKFFDLMVTKDTDPNNKKLKNIYSLLSNVTAWSERMKGFGKVYHREEKKIRPKEMEAKYSSWTKYMKKVDNIFHWVPTPVQSDNCMSEIANTRDSKHFDSYKKCETQETCTSILLNGADFGYALSHRILLLLLARLGRGCYVFSPQLDKEITNRLCSTAYGEASYIAMHDFRTADLILEQISLCSIDGQTQFLRKSWLSKLMKLQTEKGCFAKKILITMKDEEPQIPSETPRPKKWKFSNRNNHTLSDGLCDGHLTAVAAAALATAARFVLMTYY